MENNELNKGEMIVPVEDVPLTEERLMEILADQYYAMEELIKSMEDKISYRCFNGVKAELRRQFENFKNDNRSEKLC